MSFFLGRRMGLRTRKPPPCCLALSNYVIYLNLNGFFYEQYGNVF